MDCRDVSAGLPGDLLGASSHCAQSAGIARESCRPPLMELAGLEPATSWVRCTRPVVASSLEKWPLAGLFLRAMPRVLLGGTRRSPPPSYAQPPLVKVRGVAVHPQPARVALVVHP